MSSLFHLEVGSRTDTGRKRSNNEDNMMSVVPQDEQVRARKGALFIVADGLGGHDKGEVASEMVVNTVKRLYYEDASNDDVTSSLLHAIQKANSSLYLDSLDGGVTERAMGTTCIAVVLQGEKAYFANVGDSRAYLVREGQVRQVSQDHSWVADQVRAGILTKEQARIHGQRNVITRCMGARANVEVDVFTETMQEGDVLVLCTDGLSGVVTDDEIGSIVQRHGAQESVEHLIAQANENGGPDNITAIVARVSRADTKA
jgi:serine/threonine protein phosphatase PrpC